MTHTLLSNNKRLYFLTHFFSPTLRKLTSCHRCESVVTQKQAGVRTIQLEGSTQQADKGYFGCSSCKYLFKKIGSLFFKFGVRQIFNFAKNPSVFNKF